MIVFTTILLAIASGTIAGYVHPSYGYGYGGSYAAVGSPVVSMVAVYHTAPFYSGYYQSAPVGFTKYANNNGGPVVTNVAARPAYAAYGSTPAFNSAYQATPIFADAYTVSGLNGYGAYGAAPAFAAYHAVPAVSGFGKYGAYNAAPLGTYPFAPAVSTYHDPPTVAGVQGVSRISRVDPFHASPQTTVHTPAVTAVHAPPSTVAHVPAYGDYGYGAGALGYGHVLSELGYGHGLSPCGHNYAYGLNGLNYKALVHKKCELKGAM